MLPFITQAMGFGFAAGTSFGPLHSLLLNVTLSLGWRQGLLICLSPLLTDAPIILLMLFVLRQFPPDALRVIQIIGGFAVLWIAWRAWRSFRAGGGAVQIAEQPTNPSRETILKGMMVNFLNPAPYIFWGTILGPLLLDALDQSPLHGLALLVSFYGTFLGLMVVFVFVAEWLRRADPRITRGLSLASVVVMGLLGLSILWQGLTVGIAS